MNNAYSCQMGGGHNQVQGALKTGPPVAPKGWRGRSPGKEDAEQRREIEKLRGRTGRKPRTRGDPQLDKFEKLKENSWSQKSQGEGGIIRDLLAFKGEQKRPQPLDPWLKARPSTFTKGKDRKVETNQRLGFESWSLRLTSCTALGTSLCLLEPQDTHLWNEQNNKAVRCVTPQNQWKVIL